LIASVEEVAAAEVAALGAVRLWSFLRGAYEVGVAAAVEVEEEQHWALQPAAAEGAALFSVAQNWRCRQAGQPSK
jgi:hypothetical protein